MIKLFFSSWYIIGLGLNLGMHILCLLHGLVVVIPVAVGVVVVILLGTQLVVFSKLVAHSYSYQH